MEEMLKLLRENNQMLRFICNFLLAQNSQQDNRDFMINVLADLFVDGMTKNKQ